MVWDISWKLFLVKFPPPLRAGGSCHLICPLSNQPPVRSGYVLHRDREADGECGEGHAVHPRGSHWERGRSHGGMMYMLFTLPKQQQLHKLWLRMCVRLVPHTYLWPGHVLARVEWVWVWRYNIKMSTMLTLRLHKYSCPSSASREGHHPISKVESEVVKSCWLVSLNPSGWLETSNIANYNQHS